MRNVRALLLCAIACMTVSCASGGGGMHVIGNEGGSVPANDKEAIEYQKAVVRCHKMGGTRIVKISGDLRCF